MQTLSLNVPYASRTVETRGDKPTTARRKAGGEYGSLLNTQSAVDVRALTKLGLHRVVYA